MKLSQKKRNSVNSTTLESAPDNTLKITINSNVYYVGKETVVTVSDDDIAVFGRAKLMCGDKYSAQVGKGIALGRAIKNFGEALETEWLNRSITEEQYKARRS